MIVLPFLVQGASSVRTSTAKSTPCQRLWLNRMWALAND